MRKVIRLVILILVFTIGGEIHLHAQPSKDSSFSRIKDKIEQSRCKDRCVIELDMVEKNNNYIPADHFKEYFNLNRDKYSYQNVVPDTINIRGRNIPCVKLFTILIPKPDPCRDDPFRITQIKPVVLFHNEIFTSFILGMSSNITGQLPSGAKWYIDRSGSIGFRFSTKCPNKRIYYEISSNEGYFSPVSGVLYTTGSEMEVFPKIPWNYDYFQCIKERTKSTIKFSFREEGGNNLPYEIFETVHLRTLNDCIFGVNLRPMGYNINETMYWMFLAYVNEESPIVDSLRRQIVQRNPQITSWGFAGGHHVEQVIAVWDFFQSKGVTYSSISSTVDGHNSYIMSQKVRDISKSFDEKEANCIDGSVLFASLFTHWGFPCSVVVVPGHAFLSLDVKLENNEQGRFYIETTMIRNNTLIDAITQGKQNIEEAEMIIPLNPTELRNFIKPIPFKSCKNNR